MSNTIQMMLQNIAKLTDDQFDQLINLLIAADYTEAQIDKIIDIAIINALEEFDE